MLKLISGLLVCFFRPEMQKEKKIVKEKEHILGCLIEVVEKIPRTV